MERKETIKAVAIGGIFAAVYGIITALSVYVIPVLGVFSLLFLPFFSAYYSAVNTSKMMLVFDIAVTLLCFLIGIGDPIFSLLYILPSLLVGNSYGLLSKMKAKYYLTLFLQSATYSVTNILSLLLAEKIYETNIISFIVSDGWMADNLSFCILFVLSGAEAFVSTVFTDYQLSKVKIKKEKEKTVPLYLYISFVVLTLADIGVYFINHNLYFLIILFLYIATIPMLIDILKLIKNKYFLLIIYAVLAFSLNFYLCSKELYYWVPLFIIVPITVYCLVKIAFYIYNVTTKKGK